MKTRNRAKHSSSALLALALAGAGLGATPTAAQDYNNDGIHDLAVGVPSENPGGVAASSGVCQVIYGSEFGLSATEVRADQIFWQGNAGAEDFLEFGDAFGRALAAGDFNGDLRDDLAVGVPGENDLAGAVQIFYGAVLAGGVSGLDSVNDQLLRNGVEIPGDGLPWGLLGSSLAAGDFDGNGLSDLAIGAPGHAVGNPSVAGAGVVFLLWGTQSGLTPFLGGRLSELDQGPIGDDAPEEGDSFGYALLAGDFDGDGLDDLVVGVPGEGVTALGEDQGAVHVFFGHADTGFRNDDRFLTQGNAGDLAEDDDEFGLSLAAGDFDNNMWLDLAVGAPREDVGDGFVVFGPGAARGVAIRNAGAVSVFQGSALGLDLDPALPSKHLTQSTAGIPNAPEENDLFGYALAAGKFRGSLFDDLAIGVPLEDVSGVDAAGMVHVLLGGDGGLSTDDGQWLRQGRNGLVNTIEDGDQFGAALSVGKFDADNMEDLAIGAPGEGIGALDAAGAVQVVYGHFGGLDSPDKNELWHQDSADVEGSAEVGDAFGRTVHGGR